MNTDVHDDHDDSERSFMCTHVLQHERPLLLVEHYPDGDWVFLCCEEEDHNEGDVLRVVCRHCAREYHPVIRGTEDLPIGCRAVRNLDEEKWEISRLPDEYWEEDDE